jgi:hypothetical protein
MGRPETSGETANDRNWTREWWSAVRCAAVPLVLLLLLDWATDRTALWRTALWLALSALLFAVLCPARVAAGPDWLASRRLGREHRVRTDLLVSVRVLDGVSQRLLLRDALDGRVEIDPEVLLRNPQLWHHLADGARRAASDGLLLCGETALHRLSSRVDGETARGVFRVSGLE